MVAGEVTTQTEIDREKIVREAAGEIGFNSNVDNLSIAGHEDLREAMALLEQEYNEGNAALNKLFAAYEDSCRTMTEDPDTAPDQVSNASPDVFGDREPDNKVACENLTKGDPKDGPDNKKNASGQHILCDNSSIADSNEANATPDQKRPRASERSCWPRSP